MHLSQILFTLVALAFIQGSLGFWYRTDYDSPEERDLYPLLQKGAEHMDTFLMELMDITDSDYMDDYFILEELLDLSNTSSEGCRSCVAASGALKRAIQNQGVTFEDVRNISIEICMNVTKDEGWRGDIICEGAIDTWGPHVVYIFNNTMMETDDICLLLNNCQPEDIVPDRNTTVTYSAGDKPQTNKRRKDGPIDYAAALKIVHITDVHIEPEYATGAASICNLPVCCKDEWEGTDSCGPWGNYKCNLPLRTLDLYLDFLATMAPDYLMYTGDTSPNTIWEDTQERQNAMSQILVDKITSRLPGVPSYMSIGNHDAAPTNLYYAPREDMQLLSNELWEMWQATSGFTQEQLDTLKTGGFYSVLVQPGLRVMEYNSNLQTTDNFYLLLDQENNGYAAMRQFMEDTFDYARANGEKVILLSHHLSGGGGQVREYSDFITDICRRNADLIVLHLFGHSHSDSFQMNTDPVTGDVYDVQISSASMTGQTNINPEARIFYVDSVTFDVLDMDTYYLDLQNPQNNGSSPVIELAYRATVEYNMTDFSPASVKDLVDRMEQDEDLLNKYLANKETKTGFWSPCDANCQIGFFCGIRSTSYTQEQECNRNSGFIV